MPEARFAFGNNWRAFLDVLDEDRIAAAKSSLQASLGEVEGRSFLDIGSGSGLFSLAARRLGAEVFSFDYDPASVWCTQHLRERYQPGDDGWRICRGSVLDAKFMRSLKRFDVVYSWGVLHHTGRMWDALAASMDLVAPGGQLFVALYNDQGVASVAWRVVKRTYNSLPRGLRPMLVALVLARWVPAAAALDVIRGRSPLARYRNYADDSRGMSPWRDWIDWIGGYPFEVARPDEVFGFLRERGFEMLEMRTRVGWGCNEYVARRALSSP